MSGWEAMQQGAPDPFFTKALDAGGHLADDVAEVIVRGARPDYVVIDEVVELSHGDQQALAALLRSEHPELD